MGRHFTFEHCVGTWRCCHLIHRLDKLSLERSLEIEVEALLYSTVLAQFYVNLVAFDFFFGDQSGNAMCQSLNKLRFLLGFEK